MRNEKKGMKMNCLKQGHRVGLFFVVLFALCFSWYYLHPVEQLLHRRMLVLSFYRFTGMNTMSFVSGAVQSYIWGFLGVAVWELTSRLACFGKCE